MTAEETQVIERLQQATNILVTVNSNPTIDQLSACLGLTLALNKAGKHATAVFSGEVPSTLEFLQPEKTLEKTTDSLRDFIISLDKAKADKLRYKVEDNFVKIFITPYRTAISESDFEYSQGDFNVEVVIALGVRNPKELDQAITSHGRILHDATVVSINTETGTELGTLNITEPSASSLSELVSILAQNLEKDVLDSQIATALLTGIVAETERFSNEKTTPATMNISSALMAAGANQQLVATKLQEKPEPVAAEVPEAIESKVSKKEAPKEPKKVDAPEPTAKPAEPGTLEIAHDVEAIIEESNDDAEELPSNQIHVDEDGELQLASSEPELKQDIDTAPSKQNRMVLQPPTLQAGNFTANSEAESQTPIDDISLPAVNIDTMSHEPTQIDAIAPKQKPFNLSEALAESAAQTQDSSTSALDDPQANNKTLAELEEEVESSHTTPPEVYGTDGVSLPNAEEERDIDSARQAVDAAVAASAQPLAPVAALNAQSVDLTPVDAPEAQLPTVQATQPVFETMPTDSAADQPMSMPMPPANPNPSQFTGSPLFAQSAPAQQPAFAAPAPAPFMTQPSDPNAPPPVPPPMMPPSFPQQ